MSCHVMSPAALSSDTYRSKSKKFITDCDLFFLKEPYGDHITSHHITLHYITGKSKEGQDRVR